VRIYECTAVSEIKSRQVIGREQYYRTTHIYQLLIRQLLVEALLNVFLVDLLHLSVQTMKILSYPTQVRLFVHGMLHRDLPHATL